jgi:hypothetical protein
MVSDILDALAGLAENARRIVVGDVIILPVQQVEGIRRAGQPIGRAALLAGRRYEHSQNPTSTPIWNILPGIG